MPFDMNDTRSLETWLLLSAIMIFVMALIGAVTRLEEAGLSITEWNVITGALPPLSTAAWQAAFAKYQATPEFAARHFWMELDDFKYIYFWEWLHRLWGRLIGLVYALPLIYFWVRGQIPGGYKLPFLGLLGLGAAQGFVGWYMVQSGLLDRPDVSHFRLSIHLGLAAFIFATLIWVRRGLTMNRTLVSVPVTPSFCLLRHGWAAMLAVAVTVVWGGFVAGLDAGKIYNTWPHMGYGLIPIELLDPPSVFLVLAEHPAGVQFMHRWLAILAAMLVLSFAWRVKSWPLAILIIAQVGLGLATLLTVVWIPAAAAHQAGAFLVIAAMVQVLKPLQATYLAMPSAAKAAV